MEGIIKVFGIGVHSSLEAEILAKCRTQRQACLAQVGKGYAGRAAKASGKKEALALAEEGGEALAAVFTKVLHSPPCLLRAT